MWLPGTYISPAETGLYYLQSRYYDASVGRFVNGDDISIIYLLEFCDTNVFAYCNNNVINASDEYGYASMLTKNKNVNKFLEELLKAIPNIYSDDFISREIKILRIGTKNLSLTLSVGIAAQTNKNALFGGMFKRGTLEVSAALGINNFACFSFSAGVNWSKAYLKTGVLIAFSKSASGFYGGVYLELSISTWLLAAATVVAGIVCIYSPVFATYIGKIITTIRNSARVALPVIAPLLPKVASNLLK